MLRFTRIVSLALGAAVLCSNGAVRAAEPEGRAKLSDSELDNIVRRSYQYVAMYNVINKNAKLVAPAGSEYGWNRCYSDTALKDHTYRAIARPNNDTLYAGCLLDLRAEPVIVDYPAFDSKYVSLETSAYDHYCDVPLSTTKGDFAKPTKILYYTARTKGYSGEPVEGVDKTIEMSGDFVMAFLRAMPHASEPERLARNLATLAQVQARGLSAFRGTKAPSAEPAEFPAVGSDFDVFEKRFLRVMQFVFDHTTFDSADAMDRAALAALKPLGVVPGKPLAPAAVLDGGRLVAVARTVAQEQLALMTRPGGSPYVLDLFLPKGQMSLGAMVAQSVIGPIGLPAHQAVYPPVPTSEGAPMNALHDYVIRMSAAQMPPAGAFWSVTLYDAENGFFIPNDRKKYSVGENAGMKLDAQGGIAIYVAAERPDGVPEENWLPIDRGDYAIDAILRIYGPDLARFATWQPPKAEKL